MSTAEIQVVSNKQLPAEADAVTATEHWRPLWWLPCELSPQIPLANFTVRELLRLRAGSIVASNWSRSREIPLYANGQLIGWTELDSVGEHIGARITELV
ncbi:MAG TPA: FliM/FliN family flagellar motor C-terminal domain-containing protein [Terriglobales bacterium]|nr:FliM/FliN family flagellar motor C-terminal domain-containing protein [Terriglobales bacterium]